MDEQNIKNITEEAEEVVETAAVSEAVHENDVPELLDGVANLRKCSFKPWEHFIQVSFGESQEKSYYLEVKWRLFWFHVWCDENGIMSRAVKVAPATQLGSFIQASAQVIINGEVIGEDIGGIEISGGNIKYAIQQASTIAKGRALANAGFGTVFSSALTSESGGNEVICDAGVHTAEFFKRDPKNPMMLTPKKTQPAEKAEDLPFTFSSVEENNKSKPAEKATPAPENEKEQPAVKAQAADASAPATEDFSNMTREEAFKYVLEFGPYRGEALGDLNGKRPDSVRYYATHARYAGTKLQAAAKLVYGK